jgi:DNA (cytosine-5)-methyltransferase 1
MNSLNLYCGLGGNRKEWKNVNVTAVELNKEVAAIYKEYFPNDTVIVEDAHEFLLNNYRQFQFIWSSRPCTTHSRSRFWSSKGGRYAPVYPDFALYQEIIFLKHFFSGGFVVENVKPYYEPPEMYAPSAQIGRHLFWSNFEIPPTDHKEINRDHNAIGQSIYGFDLTDKKTTIRKDQLIRNCVNPAIGKYIFDCFLNSLK